MTAVHEVAHVCFSSNQLPPQSLMSAMSVIGVGLDCQDAVFVLAAECIHTDQGETQQAIY